MIQAKKYDVYTTLTFFPICDESFSLGPVGMAYNLTFGIGEYTIDRIRGGTFINFRTNAEATVERALQSHKVCTIFLFD